MALKESLASANYNTGSLRNRLASGRSASALYNNTFSLQGQSPATIAAEQQNNGGVLGGIGYLGEKIGLGFLQSVEGIWDYTAGGLAKLFGADDWAEQQFANDWVNYNDADEWYNPSEGWRFAGDVAGGIGTSLPAMVGVAAGAAIAYFSGGTLTPVAAGIISASIAGFGAAGTATKEAYRETGELGGKEFGYGFLSGATEAGVEYLSAGLGAGTGRIVQSIAKRTAKETTEAVVKTGAKSVIKNIAKDFASEAFEEGLSEILDPVYKRMTYDPNAKAATPQEVGYAALVGGLSGAIMSGSQMAINAGVNSTANLVSGNKAVESGSVSSILDMSRQLTETEIKSDTGYDIYHVIRDSYTQLAESMKNSGGNITTVKQKMLLGQLKRANTVAVFMPFVERSAMNILANAETIAERYNEFGLQADGKKITITAEQLRSGIDLSAERKTVVKQIRKALSTNSALATLAVADATGHLTMDTKRFAEASLDGTTAARPTLASRANINSFIERATPAQLESVSRALGIENWATITPEEFAEKVSAFEQNGGVEQYAKQGERIKELLSINEDKAKTALPSTLRVQKDSAVRYRENGVDIAVVRTGDTFQIYDYNEQVMSRVMTREEANAAMKEIRSAMQYAPSDADIRSDVAKRIEGQTNLARETLEIDSYAKQNVPQYEELNAPSKQAVRMTIRQAQAHGITEADTLVLAKVAAKSGLNIVFDRNIGADGMNINNTIYLNPDAAPERLRGKLLIHELDHILVKEKGGQHLITEAFLNMDAAKRNKIIERYSKFYEGKGLDAAQKIDIFTDEVASAYAEDIATDPAIWDYILSKEPTTKEKVLSFFRKSAQEYSFDDGMSTEARRYLRKFKKLFDSLSERNYQGNNTAVTEMVNPAVLHKSAETTADAEKAGRFSIQNGKVVIDTDQHIFDGVDRKDYGRTVRTYMRLHFRGKEVAGTTFTKTSEREYTSSEYTKRLLRKKQGTYDAKMRASTELDNMLRVSEYIGHEDAQHPHEYNGKGYDRYSVQFEIGGENFSGELLVAIGDNDRKTFYDVVKIKRTDSPVSEATARKSDGKSARGTIGSEVGEMHTAQNRNADASTTDIISEKVSDVNPSAKNTGADATKIAGNGVRYALSIGNDSVSVDVQEGKDLIAIHNLTEQNLLDTLKLGGFPMPSIAVVKAEQGHTDYGNISIVFGKDTIDPMLSSDNKIYGSDAWTPTSGNARTEYQVDGDKMRTFERRMEALSKKTAGGVFYNTSLVSRLGVDDASSQTPLQLAEKIATTDEAKLAYLVDRGETIEPVYKEKIYNWFGNETLQTYIDTVGAEHLSTIIEKAKIEDTAAFRSEEEGVRSIIRKQYVERRYETLKNNPKLKGRDVLAFVEQQADTYMDHNVTIFTIEDFVKDAWKYYRDGKSVTTEVDRLATSDKIQQAVSDADVIAWLEPQIAEFIGRAGIYNGKDLFDAKGNRRSFAQTHYAYTAENIVRAMKSTSPARGAGAFGVSASTLVATATPSYDSIDAVRADKKRLFVEDQTAYDAAIAEIDESLTKVEKDIMRTTPHHTDNTFDETQIIGSIIVEAATGKRTIAAVQRAFSAEGYAVTAIQAKRILDLYAEAAEIPTGYFEAKPERVVDFSEIKMVELPQSASDTLKKQLSERNIPYEVYGTTDAERTKAVQRLEGVRFALPETDSDGNTLSEQQRRFFSESAIKAVQDDGSLRISSDGALMPVYHGTNNGEFYEFDKKLAGSSNDAGWYGKGFYFAFRKGEAEYYGKRILECYLNIKNPFIFDSEMQSYDGVTSGDILFDFASFVLNMAEKFPDIAKKLTVDVAEYSSEDSSVVSKKNFVDLAAEMKEIYNSNRLSIVEVSDERHGDHYEYRIDNDVENMDIPQKLKKVIQEQYINSASWAEYLLKDGRITKEQYEDILDAIEKYGETNFETIYLHSRFETRKMAESHRLSAVLQYLSEKKYGYLEQHIPEHYMERIGNEFSAEIQRRGYDGVLQSLYGDEVVAFDSSQIKLTSNTSPTDSKDIRYALPAVTPVEPTSQEWQPTIDTAEAKKRFPSLWDVTADESETRNPTQIRSTVSTYRKIYDILKAEGFSGKVLDASSGLGYGTRAGIEEYGFKVDDIEPYPDRGYSPKYTDYSALHGKYDVIISNAVLNVLPQDQRDALVVKMGELLADGGRMFVNVRGDDVNTLSSNPSNVKIGNMEWFVSSTGSYQKGFTRSELVAYLKDALGTDFTVQGTTKFGKAAAVVTKNGNVRYALSDSQTESGLSRGQRAKFVANNTQMRQYSRTDAAATIDSIVDAIGFGDQTFWMKAGLSGKSRSEVISYLFEKLNTTKEGYRAGVALKIADYIIQNATLTEVYNEAALDSDTLQTAIDTVEAIKKYKHRFNLDAIKGEIKYKYDNKAGGIFMNWAQKNGGLTADTVAQDLSDYGIHIDAVNEADIFNQIMDTYERAKSLLAEKASKIQLAEYGSAEELAKVRQDIAREILRAYDERGAETKYARFVEKYTRRIDELSSRLRESNTYNRAVNTAVDLAGKIKDWKSGAFQNATQLKPDIFKGSIEKLGAIKSRGNLNQAGTRTIIRDLLSWYKSNQSVLTDMGRYSEEIEGIMTSIATGEKVLSDTEQAKVDAVRAKCISAGISLDGLTPHEFYAKMREWYTKKNVGAEYNPATKQLLGQLANSNHLTLQDVRGLSTVLAHFKHFVENYNKVFRDGKWQDAKPYAQKYVSQMQTGKTLKTGLFRRLLSSRYAKAFNDPMSLARFMDGYEDGFFSKTMEEWRRGAIDASVTDMRLRKPIEEFYARHKDYLKTAEAEKVTFNGVELTKREAMQLYMTLHREQAVAGIVLSGFKIRSGADSIRVNGVLANGDIITSEDIQASAASTIKALEKSLSATDKEYISVVESIYEQCRELKRQADMTRQGYTNVEDGYYVPIKRANIAHSIDADYIGESMSVSNQSFNKNTVKGAKNELIIEPIDAVLSRHIGGIAKYSSLAVAMDNFDMIYNLDISGNPNKPVTVRTESEGVWAEAESYFQNLRNDIKGKSKDPDGLNRAMQALRGGYAKAVLGLNPKVLVTQLSSFFASTSMLDYKNIARGMTIDVSDVDTYCPLAEVRNYDQTAFRAQGVLDKVGGVGNTLMKPIGAVDRFVIKRLFGACQAQIEADGGAKIGTKENKTAAGKLLERVIVETQQNSAATERSAAMRSGNEFFRTVTMFTADAMKVVGRVIDSLGETTILRAKLKAATDADVRADLTSRLKTANRKLRKSVGSLVASSVFMALVAQGFRWLYRRDDEDDNIPLNMTVDAVGNLMGGLPLVKDVYSFFADGYDISAPTYDMINSLLTSSKSVVTVCGNVVSGNGDAKETASAVKNLIFSASQFLGLPTRNAYKFVYGITNRISPETAYKIDDLFYDKNYRSDLAKAVENDDDRMTDTLLSLLGGETVGAFKSTETRDTIKRLLKSGYTVLPKSIGDSITFGGEKFELDAAGKATFRQVYGEASPVVEEMVASSMFRALGEQEQAKAIKQVYDAYYEKAAHAALGVRTDNKTIILGKYMDIGKLAMSNAAISSLESDKDKSGKTVQGSKKKKVMRYLMSQQMTDVERLLILYSLGYTLSDGEYRDWSAKNAKKRLLRFILSKGNATAEEKAYLAQICGFTVKNGKIVASSLS